MTFEAFFRAALGDAAPHGPFDYQGRLVEEPWPELLNVPTGLGKTAAVVLAWLYKRRVVKDASTPRRLVYCLPMRTLVEQVEGNVREWLERLDLLGEPGSGRVSTHVLMGGAANLRRAMWADYPEEDAILVGTQDQLLSRALLRGYGMSRYQWSVHFALLHSDAMWVFDEVQLMGPGVGTSAQLEGFRRAFECARPARSLWVSATLNRCWLETVDLHPHVDGFRTVELSDADRKLEEVRRRVDAGKRVECADTRLAGAKTKKGDDTYARNLAAEVLRRHRSGSRTLVVLNRVDRAQSVYQQLRQQRADIEVRLVHSRFRPPDRQRLRTSLTQEAPEAGQIVVATQAVEAGVDMTSAVLFTELAPWSSIVQRLGRCNRYGEEENAEVHWIDIDPEEALALPYDVNTLDQSRKRLSALKTASPGSLPSEEGDGPEGLLVRRKDLLELFNTDPDLSGFDVDVFGFIRDVGPPQVQVFWREIDERPAEDEPAPHRDELCTVPLTRLREHVTAGSKQRATWSWDPLGPGSRRRGMWVRVWGDAIRPGMTVLLAAGDGGYSPELGFVPGNRASVEPLPPEDASRPEDFGEDWRSVTPNPVGLSAHLAHAAEEARELCKALDEPRANAVVTAATWHDVGKAHPVFQGTMTRCDGAPPANQLWAKSPCRGRHERPYFRHELASMLSWIEHGPRGPDHDLIAFLIAAHHGKVRMGLRALPREKEPNDPDCRYARGIHEGDPLPEVDLPEGRVPETTLWLDLMELGESEQGASWTERTRQLLDSLGPFRLAWLEALVRIADWRASRKEQE